MAMIPMRVSVVWALRILGGRNAGTPLATASTPVRVAHPLAKARRSSKHDRRLAQGRLGDRVDRGLGDGECPRGVPDEADDEHDADAADEEVGGDGEGLAGFAHAAKIHGDEDDDEEDRHLRRGTG